MTDLLQILAAGIGTVAFGALFGVPSKYYPYCGLIGASGWAVYVFLWMRTGFWSEAVVVFFGDSVGYSDVPFFCCAGALPGDDFFNLRYFTARAGSRNILDVLLPGDGTAGRSFYPRIFCPQGGGCDCAWNCVRI